MLRGINRQQIFETGDDYIQMLEILSDLHIKFDDLGHIISDNCCKIYAYCLMGNHLHLLIQEADMTIADLIKTLASRYVFYYNRYHCRVGHLFQERFKSEPVEDRNYFIELIRYIHQNPVKAGIVRNANEYRWSSWHEYLSPTTDNICDIGFALSDVSLSDLQAMLVDAKPSEHNFIDIDESDIAVKVLMTDSYVREKLLEASRCNSIAEFQRQSIKERKDACAKIRALGAGVRQLARISGMGVATISKL